MNTRVLILEAKAQPIQLYKFLPEASFGLRVLPLPVFVSLCPCVCLRLCVCVCVYQSWACPHDYLSPVQARITNLDQKYILVQLRTLLIKGFINLYFQCHF